MTLKEDPNDDSRREGSIKSHLSFPLELPYFRRVEELPAPLPSITEIHNATQTLSTRQSLRRIVRVREHFVVKYGAGISLIEGENLLFIKQSCGIAVPEVYALFRDEATRTNYVIIQFISGRSLATLWDSLDERSKNNITGELRKAFDELRQIPPHDYYGKLGNRPYFDEIFMSLETETYEQICGPFPTETDLINGIVRRYSLECPWPQRGEYLRRILPLVLHSAAPVFTHGDLQRKNVIVGENGVLYIIDWEAAAFYPQYYEYYTTMVAFGHYKDDWHVWVGRFLDEYIAELGWLDTVRRELL